MNFNFNSKNPYENLNTNKKLSCILFPCFSLLTENGKNNCFNKIKMFIDKGIYFNSDNIIADENICKIFEINSDVFGTVKNKNSMKLNVLYFLNNDNKCIEINLEKDDYLFKNIQQIVNFDKEIEENLCKIYKLEKDNENCKLLFRKETEEYEYNICNPFGEKEEYEKLTRKDFSNETEWEDFQCWENDPWDYFGCSKLVHIKFPKYNVDEVIILTASYRGNTTLPKNIDYNISALERVYIFTL